MFLPYTFLVIPNLQFSVILGINFLKATQAKIDIANRIVYFADELVATPLISENNELKTISTITLPPNYESIIPVKLSKNLPKFHIYISESTPRIIQKNVLAAKSLITPKNRYTMCKLINLNKESVTFPSNSTIAVLTHAGNIKPYDNNVKNIIASTTTNTPFSEMETELKQLGLKITETSFSEEAYREFIKLLYNNKDLFTNDLSQLPGTDILKFSIDTGDAPPVRMRPYRHPPKHRAEIRRQCDELLKVGIISKSTSPWSSPVILVSKPGTEDYRLVVDWRGVNKVTRAEHFPLPHFQDVIDVMSEEKPNIFSVIDLSRAFHQINVKEEDREKTAMNTGEELYHWNRCGFGLKNIPTFDEFCIFWLKYGANFSVHR